MAGGLEIALEKNLIVGILLFGISGLFDMVDGAVAREKKEVSEIGGFLDGFIDRFVEASFLFSLMFYQELPNIFLPANIWLSLVLFFGTLMPSFIRAYAYYKGVISKQVADNLSGIFERAERIGGPGAQRG